MKRILSAISHRLRQWIHTLFPWLFCPDASEPTAVEDVRTLLLGTRINGHAPRPTRRRNTYFLFANDHQDVYFWSKSLAGGGTVQKQRNMHGVSYFTFRLTDVASLSVVSKSTTARHFATGVVEFAQAKAPTLKILFFKPN